MGASEAGPSSGVSGVEGTADACAPREVAPSSRPSVGNWAVCRCWHATLGRAEDEPLGLGIWVNESDNYLLVTEVTPNSQAHAAGLKPRDLITKVDDMPAGTAAVDFLNKTYGIVTFEVLRFERPAADGEHTHEADAKARRRDEGALRTVEEEREVEEAIARSLSLERKRKMEISAEESALTVAMLQSQEEADFDTLELRRVLAESEVEAARRAALQAQLDAAAAASCANDAVLDGYAREESMLTESFRRACAAAATLNSAAPADKLSAVQHLECLLTATNGRSPLRSQRTHGESAYWPIEAKNQKNHTRKSGGGGGGGGCSADIGSARASEGVYEAQHHFVLQQLTSASVAAFLTEDAEVEDGTVAADALRRQSEFV